MNDTHLNSDEYIAELITRKLLSDAGIEKASLSEFEQKRAEKELEEFLKKL